MKRNIMKLSVLVGVSVITLFIMVNSASADRDRQNYHYYIAGVYAVTGISGCDPTSPGILEADYTFRHDGTGSLSGVGRNISASGGSHSTVTADFTYTITKEGRIEFEYPFPPGGMKVDFNNDGVIDVTMNAGPSHGVISPDHKTISITCGHPIPLYPINPVTGDELCDCPVWCITSVVGMRIR
jgi:hypothetical protein